MNNVRKTNSMLAVATICGMIWLAAAPGKAEQAKRASVEHYRANVISLGGLGVGGITTPSGTTTAEFMVQRFSTDAERKRLLDALQAGGRGELWRTLGKMDPVGQVQTQGNLSYDLRYAREVLRGDGQRLLILATDRPLRFRELLDRTRSREFDISVIELVVDPEGDGSGTAMPAVQVELDPDSGDISLVNLNTLPLQLSNVRKIK